MIEPIIITLLLNLNPIQEKKVLLQIETGCQFTINSGDRTKEHNKRVGGTSGSYHLKKDMAYDLSKDKDCGLSYKKIGKLARKHFNGVIVYPKHIHVDLRTNPYYNNNGKY